MTDPKKKNGEPKIHGADTPSETAGLPEMGDGASGAGYLRDVDTKNTEADVPLPADAPDADGDDGAMGDHGKPTGD